MLMQFRPFNFISLVLFSVLVPTWLLNNFNYRPSLPNIPSVPLKQTIKVSVIGADIIQFGAEADLAKFKFSNNLGGRYTVSIDCLAQKDLLKTTGRSLALRTASCSPDYIINILTATFSDLFSLQDFHHEIEYTIDKVMVRHWLLYENYTSNHSFTFREWGARESYKPITKMLQKLKGVYDLSTEFKLSLYNPLQVPTNGEGTVSKEDARLFFNKNWVSSLLPSLHLVQYHSSSALSLEGKAALIIPRFGGVVLSRKQEGDIGRVGYMLRELLGIGRLQTRVKSQLETGKGVSDLELDVLMLRRMSQNFKKAHASLHSLQNVIASLDSLVLKPSIVAKVKKAALALQISDTLDESWKNSQKALEMAESSFFDPSILGMLYFPTEHLYAIYLPLFLPVFMPIIKGMIGNVGNWRKQRKLKIN